MFTLGRKIDIHYSTNRIIVILSILVAVVGWIITGEILSGVYIGGGTFLTWALAREVDPKYEYSAFLCAFFSLLNLFYYKNIQLLVIFWILLIIRLINGITGKELTFLDIFSVLGLTIYLSINNQNSIYLIPFIVAMGFVINFKEKMESALIAGGIGVAAFVVESFFMKYLSFNRIDYSDTINIFAIAMVLISFVFWSFLSKDHIINDVGNMVKRSTILSGQVIYSLIVLLIYFFGDISINNLIIYLSVITGVIIYWIGYKLFTKNRSKV